MFNFFISVVYGITLNSSLLSKGHLWQCLLFRVQQHELERKLHIAWKLVLRTFPYIPKFTVLAVAHSTDREMPMVMYLGRNNLTHRNAKMCRKVSSPFL